MLATGGFLASVENVTVEDPTVTDRATGVEFLGASTGTVLPDDRVNADGGDGVHFESSSDNTATGNVVWGYRGEAVAVTGASGGDVVEDNPLCEGGGPP